VAQSILEIFLSRLQHTADLNQFIHRKRDLILINIDEEYQLVIGCDSNAAIGMKEYDYVQRDYKEVGRCASKVPLMEVIAAGAYPFIIVDNLCVELDPSGKGILEGIRFEVARLGLDPDLVITGSTEKNMLTRQTGLGVTVIGLAKKKDIMIGSSKHSDVVMCVGLPKSAPTKPFFEGEPDIMDPLTTRKIREMQFIHDMIPVGSHGVRYEANILAAEAGCKFEEIPSPVDMTHSAGPSTCILVSFEEEYFIDLKSNITHPVQVVGYLRRLFDEQKVK